MNCIRIFFLSILIVFLNGCIPKQDDVKNAFQTNAANTIKNDYQNIQKLLISFKEKLDKRNPNSYSKNLSNRIYRLIDELEDDFLLKHNNSTLSNYKDYLQIAFSKDSIYKRNDYLVLGLYYLVHSLYEISDGHKVTAFLYDKEKLHKLYQNLQIIKWKIKVDKDVKDNYLFLTWQNNWQIELEQKIKNEEKLSYQDLLNLKFIKNNKETLLDPSNFSFEVILTQMNDRVRNSLEALGEEPKDLTIGTLRAIFLFL